VTDSHASSLRRNIELKARCGDLSAARQTALAMGARDAGLLIQTDTYFNVPNGRLKLREIQSDHAELIWYSRPNQLEPRPSDYVVVPVCDPAAIKQALDAALGIRTRVYKRRQLLLWQNVRIHLDEVESLGTFVEFEAVLVAGETESAAHERLRELSARLGIREADRLSVSYSEMI
jgi:predicted adenylyl cyclase CyaB